MTDITKGTTLTCTNDDCTCELTVVEPCPHGSDYTCGCGHPFTAVTSDTGGA